MTNEHKDFDIVDLITLIVSVCVVASFVAKGGTLAIGILFVVIYFVQHGVRRANWFEGVVDLISHPTANDIARGILLPAPKNTQTMTIYQDKPLDVNITNESSFWKSITDPTIKPSDNALLSVVGTYNTAKQQNNLVQHIKRLPRYVSYKQLEAPPSKLAVPIGIDSATKKTLWADFGSELDTKIMHALIAGYTGSGKDALLRLWFTTLTTNNTPEELQFVIIDGKVDWLSPALAESAYMAIPPSGGVDIQKKDGKFVDCAKDQMRESFEWIFEEVHRRQKLFSSIGAVDMQSYTKKSGESLPYIFFIASDVGETFDGDLKMLTNLLIAKGRAYGIRLIISLQNPVGEGTKWRSQISLIMTGYQANTDHDRYTLGMNVERMQFRPSLLPNPDENDISKGLFVVRRGSSQHLVRTAHLPEDDWFMYIESIMKTKKDYSRQSDDINLLTRLLLPDTQPQRILLEPPKVKLTEKQINDIQLLTMQGKNKTEIMIEYLKATNPDKYKAFSPVVETLMKAVKRKITNAA